MQINRRVALGIIAAALARPAWAGEPSVYQQGGYAIRGYDPVAYFTTGGPEKGSPEISSSWKGAKWLFSNKKNKALFDAEPESYAPKYGGYCAYAVSRGYTASTDPDAWTVHDGALYLNYNKPVRLLWSQNIPKHVRSADGNWPTVLR